MKLPVRLEELTPIPDTLYDQHASAPMPVTGWLLQEGPARKRTDVSAQPTNEYVI